MRAVATGLRAAVDAATERLLEAGVASPRHDAEALAAHVVGTRRAGLRAVDALDPAQAAAFAALLARRAGREPLQHLTGRAGFRHLDLAVGPGVFVPRPETEVLVQWVLDHAPPRAHVADLCSGSGAVALSLARERPDLTVEAVECEPAAFGWLERNAAECRAAGDAPVALHLADAASALRHLDGTLDVVVANPPYLPDGQPVEPEVGAHDPGPALWGGPDGLAGPRLVAAAGARLLRPGGLLAVEHADLHGEAAPGLLRAAHAWRDVADHADLAGRPRFVTAVRA